MRWLQLVCLSVYAGAVSAIPSPRRVSPRQASTSTTSSPDAVSTACGDIIDNVNEGYFVFYASEAYECLISVPFNADVAMRFLDYYNSTMQFQSNLAYVKSPPTGYQQPASDFFAGLEQLKQNVTSGVYKNEYAFEADLQFLVYSIHDAHVDLYAGILSAFSFASPYTLLTASVDGKEVPKVYLEDDIISRQVNGTEIQAITKINDVPVVEYLEQFAALNSQGMVEPHADWNQLMGSPAQDIQYAFNVFSGGVTFYPGIPSLAPQFDGDELTFTYEDGTNVSTWWLAIYSNPEFTGPLTTGGDFYNYFVLGLLPASYNEVPLPDVFNYTTNTDDDGSVQDNTPVLTNWSSYSIGYPNKADIYQAELAPEDTNGVVTGYFLDDISTGVLSIPSFDQAGEAVADFSDAVQYFIDNATQRNTSKVIIDLQQNSGGAVLLVFVMFKQFFPQAVPFAGSQRRSHQLANIVGSVTTGYWATSNTTQQIDLENSEWVVTDRINAATGTNFTSWDEYYGPRSHYNGDDFSAIERYDLANEFFDELNFDDWVPTDYLPEDEPTDSAPWAAEDIVILTDGVCSSACSLFLEMMVQEGVRTVVMGGNPNPGPMQAAAGTRGARPYSSELLHSDFDDVAIYDSVAAAQLPSLADTGINVNVATFNLRDQIRENQTVPLQFVYSAANCRLWYTLDSVYNMTVLWHDVARAALNNFNDSSLCVQGSTGYATTGNSTVANAPPKSTATALPGPGLAYSNAFYEEIASDLTDAHSTPAEKSVVNTLCDSSKQCASGTCEQLTITCANGATTQQFVCVSKCTSGKSGGLPCGVDQQCNKQGTVESIKNTVAKPKKGTTQLKIPIFAGFCIPSIGNPSLGCPAVSQTA